MKTISQEKMNSTAAMKTELERTQAELERYQQDSEEFRIQFDRDLRTGLNCILGFAELLEMRANGTDRDSVQQILKAGREMLGLVDPKLGALGRPSNLSHPAAEPVKRHLCDVLYVEDNDANYTLVQHILAARPSLTMTRAECGQSGIALAFEKQPRLIFLDLNLPDIHGSEVLQLLRLRPETATIPVVVISADAMPSQIERLLAGGARNYLTKPFRIEPMLAIVDEVLNETVAPAIS